MKRDELRDMFRPSPAASTAIINWLKSEGVGTRQIEDDGDWINFYIAATEAERILDTKFYYYKNKLADIRKIRTLRYSLPQDLHQYISMIQPTTRFGQIQPQRSHIYQHFEIGPSINTLALYPGQGLNVSF